MGAWRLAGPLRSRAAKAIGFIDDMINYSTSNAPLQKELDSGKSDIHTEHSSNTVPDLFFDGADTQFQPCCFEGPDSAASLRRLLTDLW